MTNRASGYRKGESRILFWSLMIAVALHVALFLLWPTMSVEPVPESKAGSGSQGVPVYVDVFFGPPDILEKDGSVSREPPERAPNRCEALALYAFRFCQTQQTLNENRRGVE